MPQDVIEGSHALAPLLARHGYHLCPAAFLRLTELLLVAAPMMARFGLRRILSGWRSWS